MKKRVALTLIILGLLLWVLSAVVDYLTLPGQPFFDRLFFSIPNQELLFRVAALLVLAVTGLLFSRNSANHYLESKIDELRKSNDGYSSLLNNLPVGVYRATLDGRIIDANRQFAEILGFKEVNELRKVNLNDVCVDKSGRQEHLERLRQSPVFAEFELRRADGRTVWVRDYPRASVDSNGTIACVDGVCVETHGIDAIMLRPNRTQTPPEHEGSFYCGRNPRTPNSLSFNKGICGSYNRERTQSLEQPQIED